MVANDQCDWRITVHYNLAGAKLVLGVGSHVTAQLSGMSAQLM